MKYSMRVGELMSEDKDEDRGMSRPHRTVDLTRFAQNLKRFRERRGLTMAQLADRAHVNLNTLRTWRQGQHRPQQWRELLWVARELRLTVDEVEAMLHDVGHLSLAELGGLPLDANDSQLLKFWPVEPAPATTAGGVTGPPTAPPVALPAIPADRPSSTPGEQLRTAIETDDPDQVPRAAAFMAWLAAELGRQAPDYTTSSAHLDLLLAALAQTEPLVAEFTQVAHALGRHPAARAAREIYKRFGTILKSYNAPRVPSGRASLIDEDFYKFLGHELFATLFSVLLQREHWDLITHLLAEGIYMEGGPQQLARTVPFYRLSERGQLLDVRDRHSRDPHLKPGYWALHAQVLEDRHTQGGLAELAPFPQFAAADYLLFLRTLLQPAEVDGAHNGLRGVRRPSKTPHSFWWRPCTNTTPSSSWGRLGSRVWKRCGHDYSNDRAH